MPKRVSVFESKMKQAIAAGEIQFFTDMSAMRIDGSGANSAFSGNFPRCFSLGDSFKDAAFSRSQMTKPWLSSSQ